MSEPELSSDHEPSHGNVGNKLDEACSDFDCTTFFETDCQSERDISLFQIEPTALNSTQNQDNEANFTLSERDPVSRCICCASKVEAMCNNITADGLIAVVKAIEFIEIDQDSVLSMTDDDAVDIFVETKSEYWLACNPTPTNHFKMLTESLKTSSQGGLS